MLRFGQLKSQFIFFECDVHSISLFFVVVDSFEQWTVLNRTSIGVINILPSSLQNLNFKSLTVFVLTIRDGVFQYHLFALETKPHALYFSVM